MFVGIDQALGHSGVAVLDEAGAVKDLRVVVTGDLRGAERLAAIWDGIDAVVSRYAVKQAAIEGYAYDATGRTFDLGEVGGLVRLLLYRLRVPFVVVAPAALKKFAGCPPQAEKAKVAAAVLRKWGVMIAQNDACDAYVLAQVARLFAGGTSTVRDEFEVIAALKAPKKKALDSKGRKTITI